MKRSTGHFLRTLMSAAIIYTLVLSPVAANKAFAQTQPQFENTNVTGVDQSLNGRPAQQNVAEQTQQQGTGVASGSSADATVHANERGQKLKRGYLEMLVMMSFALTALISPIPTRTDRSKNDCMANFSGPVSLFLVKLMGIMHVMAEIRTFDKYNEKAAVIRELTSGVSKSQIQGLKDGEQAEKKLINYDDMQAKLIELYTGQQEALREKSKSLDRVDGTLTTALALEVLVAGACTGICMGHQTVRKAEKTTLEAAIAAYFTSVSVAATTYGTVLSTNAGASAEVTIGAIGTLKGLVTAYVTAVNAQLVANATAEVPKVAATTAENVTFWAKITKAIGALFAPEVADSMELATQGFDTVMVQAENTKEMTLMTKNEMLGTQFKTMTTTKLAAIVTAMTQLRLAPYLDSYKAYAAAASLCSGATIGFAACYVPKVVAIINGLLAFNAAHEAALNAQRAIAPTYMAIDKTINVLEKIMGQGIGRFVAGAEKMASTALNKLLGGLKLSPTAATDAAGIAKNAESLQAMQAQTQEAMDALQKQLAGQTIGQLFPVIGAYETMLDKRLTCCGSDGRKTTEPSYRIPFPMTPGILYKKRDMVPPSGLFVQAEPAEEALPENDLRRFSQQYLEEKVASGQGDELYREVMTAAMRNVAVSMVHDEYAERTLAGERLSRHDVILMEARLESARKHGEHHFEEHKLTPEDKSTIQLAFDRVISEMGIPAAHAGIWDNLGGFMGLGAVFLAIRYRTAVKKVYSMATKAPIYRVAFYTVLKLLVGWIKKGNDESIATIQKQIEYLTQQRELYRQEYTGGPGYDAARMASKPVEVNFTFSNPNNAGLAAGSRNQRCINFKETNSELAPCPAKNSARSFSIPNRRVTANFQAFNTAYDSIEKLGEALSNSDAMGKEVDVLSANLGAAAKKLEADANKMQAELNALHADKDKSGKKSSPMKRMVGQALAAMGPNGSGMMSNFGGFGMSTDPNLNKDEGSEVVAPTGEGAGVAPDALGIASPGDWETPAEEYKLDGDVIDASSITGTEAPVGGEQKLEDFELAESEINTDSQTSIFTQISRRYLLSYPKVLEFKKAPEGEPVKTPESAE